MALKAGQGLANWEIATVKKLVSEQRRKYWILERYETDDLVQEILTHWISIRSRLHQDADARPPVAYLAQVSRNRLTDLIRERSSDKRAGDSGALSLEASVVEDEDGLTLGETLADDATEGAVSVGLDARDVRIDLTRVLERLTPAQQALCRLLGEEGISVKEAAERLGIPRGTLYEEIKRVRKVFSQNGLDAYLLA